MKNKIIIITLAITALAVLSLQVKPASPDPRNPLVKQLQHELKFTEELKKEVKEAFVYASITIDNKGKISVLETNASDALTKEYVVHRLREITVNTSGLETDKTYNLKINFKTIN